MTESATGALAVTYDSAAREALDAFGVVAAELELVSASENLTFRVSVAGSDGSFVLRLHRPGYHDLDELNSERVWLDALQAAGIAVPQPLPAPDGRYYVPIAIPAVGEIRFAGLAHWAEGEIVGDLLEGAGDASLGETNLGRLGALMASMHNQASGWVPPPTFRRHRLDADGLLGETPYWGPFWANPSLTAAEGAVLLATRDMCREVLLGYGSDPRTFSMIHADLHLENLLVDGDELSVIDFDDAGFGWHQYDIAVAMFHSGGLPNADVAKAAFFDEYRKVRELSEQDAALVPMFELIRGMAIIGWKAQRPEVAWPDDLFDEIKDIVLGRCSAFEVPI